MAKDHKKCVFFRTPSLNNKENKVAAANFGFLPGMMRHPCPIEVHLGPVVRLSGPPSSSCFVRYGGLVLDKDDETCWAAVAYAPKFNTSRPTRPAWVSGPAFAWTKLDSRGLRLELKMTRLAWLAGPEVNDLLFNLHLERC